MELRGLADKVNKLLYSCNRHCGEKKVRILTIVGARPQFIKTAPVSKCLSLFADVEEVVVHTGQHYDEKMSAIFFQELNLRPPAFHLEVGSGTHGQQTGRMLEKLDGIMRETKPNWVLVYGDTNSTLAGALAAAKLNIRVAHVEAGLRSFNREMPEEVNRIATDHVSSVLFAPTATAMRNLKREGVTEANTHLVGDVMYDSTLMFSHLAPRSRLILSELGIESGNYILATIHRAENTDHSGRLATIFGALSEISTKVKVIVALHPRTKLALSQLGLVVESSSLKIIEPVGYLDMLELERKARAIFTDSGGVQKEAYFHGVPCAVVRDQTEWVELLETGLHLLVPPVGREALLEGLNEVLAMPVGKGPTGEQNLFGGGKAASRIASILRSN